MYIYENKCSNWEWILKNWGEAGRTNLDQNIPQQMESIIKDFLDKVMEIFLACLYKFQI